MDLSKIDQNINYLESNNLDKNDEGESYAYRAKIFGKKVKFVLGKPNFQHIDNNIVYFNIYLVNNTELVAKIGIFVGSEGGTTFKYANALHQQFLK